MGVLAFADQRANTAAHVLSGIVAGAPQLPPWVRGLTAILFATYQYEPPVIPWRETAEFLAGYAVAQL